MKHLVETTGPFMLMDNGTELSASRPSVAKDTNFIHYRMSLGQLRLLGKLRDDATDEEFAKYWRESEGDAALAVASFLSAFGLEEVTQKGAVELPPITAADTGVQGPIEPSSTVPTEISEEVPEEFRTPSKSTKGRK